MRMWMINPKLLCRKHLLGEHGEIHKHRHNFVKKHNMTGRAGQIDPYAMQERHDELALEMEARGYNHNSPYEKPDVSYLGDMPPVDLVLNIQDLSERCSACRSRIDVHLKILGAF